MFCTRCGLGIPDDVHVCWACGAQQPSDHLCVHCGIILPSDAPACLACGAVQSPKTWEYCEIRVEHGTKDTDAIGILAGQPPYTDQFRFWADGAGPAGVYTLGYSDWAEGAKPAEWHRDLFERLAEELRTQGWLVLPREGGEWWAQQFRREISSGTRPNDPPYRAS